MGGAHPKIMGAGWACSGGLIALELHAEQRGEAAGIERLHQTRDGAGFCGEGSATFGVLARRHRDADAG